MPENRVIVWVQNRGDRDHLSLEWHDPATGKRKSKSAGTCNPLEAEKRRADLEYELNHGLHTQASGMSWERFRELFEEEHIAFRRPSTKDNYSAAFDGFEKLCAPRSLRSVSERTASAFAAAMQKAGLAVGTIRQRLTLLRTALRWACGQKLIPEVPRFPAIKIPRKRPQAVPLESFERLLDKAPDANMRAFLLTGWLAGLRLQEAAALEWEPTEEAPYLDPAAGRIVLPAAMVKAVEDQWVPLDPELWDVLNALPRHGKKVFRFVDERDGHTLGRTGVGERVIRLAKRAGVKLSMRTLRRGFGCRYAGRVPAQVLQKLMRHASISTTMTYYANVDDAAMAAVRGKRRAELEAEMNFSKRVTGRVTEPEGQGRPEKAEDANLDTATGSGGE
jgi:integrase